MPGARTKRGEAELQERDLAILQGLFESRLMTLNHITHLFFNGHGEAAKKRIQQLKADRYIRERPRRVYHPSILHCPIAPSPPFRSVGCSWSIHSLRGISLKIGPT